MKGGPEYMGQVHYDSRQIFSQLRTALKKGNIAESKALSDELISFNDDYLFDQLTPAEHDRLEEFRASAVAD